MVLLWPALAAAQPRDSDAFLLQQRRIEEQVRSELNRDLPAEQKIDLDAGAWYSFYLMQWDDGINSSRTYRQHDFRVWGSASFDEGAHQLYGRFKLLFQDWNHGDSYSWDEDDTFHDLDRGFYQFDLRQAMRAYEGENIDWNFKFKIGRDLVNFGTAYAFSQPMDHIALTLEAAKFEWTTVGGMSVRSYPDIDRSRPSSGDNERNFWGTQVTYTGIPKHRPFAYAVWNKDQKTDRWSVLQKFDYDSYYVGFGSTGELMRNLRYGTEWVYEGGKAYGWHDFLAKDEIDAWALDAQLEYLSQWKLSPKFSFEYMFASGDGNRRYSPTNTIGGNVGQHDKSFSGFGYRDTGLSFAPRLSNIHVWRAGAAFKPFEDIEWLRQIETGTDWFLYAKNRSDGAVSDPTADRQSGYLGWEMDYFINWRITSDLSYTVRLGTFFPGKSFSDQTTRTFFLTGVTWSF